MSEVTEQYRKARDMHPDMDVVSAIDFEQAQKRATHEGTRGALLSAVVSFMVDQVEPASTREILIQALLSFTRAHTEEGLQAWRGLALHIIGAGQPEGEKAPSVPPPALPHSSLNIYEYNAPAESGFAIRRAGIAVRHIPTGIEARCHDQRTAHANREVAMRELERLVSENGSPQHITHCCIVHGCKYGEDDCPVASERVAQKHPCEYCSDDASIAEGEGAMVFTADVPADLATSMNRKLGSMRSEVSGLQHALTAKTEQYDLEVRGLNPDGGQIGLGLRGEVAELRAANEQMRSLLVEVLSMHLPAKVRHSQQRLLDRIRDTLHGDPRMEGDTHE